MAPVQEAVDAVLVADPRFGEGRVFDAVPDAEPGWYVVIGDLTEVPSAGNTHDDDGRELTITIHVWSSAKGFHEAQDVVGWLDELLHRQPLAVTGWRTVSLVHVSAQTLRDGDWRHIPVIYRIDLQRGA